MELYSIRSIHFKKTGSYVPFLRVALKIFASKIPKIGSSDSIFFSNKTKRYTGVIVKWIDDITLNSISDTGVM